MQRTAIYLMAVVAGCGDVSNAGPDASTADAPPPDSAVSTQACDLSKPFGTPVNFSELNSDTGDHDLTFSADRLTAYFTSTRAGGLGSTDIYYASRPSVTSPFAAPQLLPNLNTAMVDSAPLLSADQLTLYYTTGAAGETQIHIATRASTAGAFANPTELLNVNATAQDVPTWINETGTTLYISSTRTGDWEMLRATRSSASGPFSAATPIGELNIAMVEDYGAVLTADELTVYFESRRTGVLGCYDIFVATRTTKNDGFGTPTPVTELNTDSCEWPTWVSPDGCEIAFVSSRVGSLGGHDLWHAKRPPI